MQLRKEFKRGFSLFEVLIFTTIISLFFIAAATLAVFSLRNIKSEENKILATRYAEELIEWLRGEKEEDWEYFATNRMGSYCFSQEPIPLDTPPTNSWPAKTISNPICDPAQPGQLINSLFRRELTLSGSVERVDVSVSVTWNDAGTSLTIPIKTVFERFGE